MFPETLALVGLFAAVGAAPAGPPAPVFDPAPPPAAVKNFPEIEAEAWLFADFETGQILAGENPDRPHPPASLAKLPLAAAVLDRGDLAEKIPVPRTPAPGSRRLVFPGEKFSRADLLRAALVFSANDAAKTLAADFENFPEAVRRAAEARGAADFRPGDPAGLDTPGARISARAAANLFRSMLKKSPTREILGQKSGEICPENPAEICRNFTTTDRLLGAEFGDFTVRAGKTGTTPGAGENLALFFEKKSGGGRVLILLGSADRWAAARAVGDFLVRAGENF